jgi:hypothetical protein
MTVLLNYLYNVMVALSQLFNVLVLLGDPDETTSGRIGKSLANGGLATRVPWPGFMRRHFIASIELNEGADSAFGRQSRV